MDTAELNLHRAVMAQAVLDVVDFLSAAGTGLRRSRPEQIAFRSACEWIDGDEDYPFSFRRCCRLLGLNRQRVRRQMTALTRSVTAAGFRAIAAFKQEAIGQ